MKCATCWSHVFLFSPSIFEEFCLVQCWHVGGQVDMCSVLALGRNAIYRCVGLHSCLSLDACSMWAAGWSCLLNHGFWLFVLEAGFYCITQGGL